MPKTTSKYAKTTIDVDISDALGAIMKSLRISGSVLLNEDYAPPWGVTIPSAERLRAVMKLDSGVRVVAFHVVKRGYIELTPDTLDGGGRFTIEPEEMAICFGGLSHRVSQGVDPHSVSAESLLTGGKNPFQPDSKNKARSVSLMCGVFMMRNVALNPLFSSLPAVLHLSAQRPGRSHHLPEVLKWMTQEAEQITPGHTFVIERLLELLCAEVLRAHLETSMVETGWFSGLKDPVVGKAISMIHARPGEFWTVERLAQGVSMSPSRFAARFTAALGESPMAYVTKWRMNVAGRLLEESKQGIQEIAANVGYGNVAAFTRAFRRHLGIPPATWRSHHVG